MGFFSMLYRLMRMTSWVDVTLGFVLATERDLKPLPSYVVSIRSQLNLHVATTIV